MLAAKIQYATKGLRHSALFSRSCKFTPLPFWLDALTPQQCCYFHGQEIAVFLWNIEDKERGHVGEGCHVKNTETDVIILVF